MKLSFTHFLLDIGNCLYLGNLPAGRQVGYLTIFALFCTVIMLATTYGEARSFTTERGFGPDHVEGHRYCLAGSGLDHRHCLVRMVRIRVFAGLFADEAETPEGSLETCFSTKGNCHDFGKEVDLGLE